MSVGVTYNPHSVDSVLHLIWVILIAASQQSGHMAWPESDACDMEEAVWRAYYVCLHFQGANCPFNHDALRNKRFEVCKYHLMQTGCNKGDNCIYMHDILFVRGLRFLKGILSKEALWALLIGL